MRRSSPRSLEISRTLRRDATLHGSRHSLNELPRRPSSRGEPAMEFRGVSASVRKVERAFHKAGNPGETELGHLTYYVDCAICRRIEPDGAVSVHSNSDDSRGATAAHTKPVSRQLSAEASTGGLRDVSQAQDQVRQRPADVRRLSRAWHRLHVPERARRPLDVRPGQPGDPRGKHDVRRITCRIFRPTSRDTQSCLLVSTTLFSLSSSSVPSPACRRASRPRPSHPASSSRLGCGRCAASTTRPTTPRPRATTRPRRSASACWTAPLAPPSASSFWASTKCTRCGHKVCSGRRVC